MPAPTSAKRLLMVGALVVVVAMLAAHPTEVDANRGGSYFVFFSHCSRDSCSGNQTVLDACGCNTIPFNTRKGYGFTFLSQTAAAYNGPLCTGEASMHFDKGIEGLCSPAVEWKSVFIHCSVM